MRAVVMALAVVAAVGALAGCNDDTITGGQPVGNTPTSIANQGGSPGTVAAPGEVASPATATTLPTRDDANVDARDFQQGDKFYFQSPSGNILCGFINANGIGTGCQLVNATHIPAELADCGGQANRKVAAEVNGGAAKYRCLNQGLFVGQPVDGTNKGGGKVLQYGQTIIVRGTACTSMESGVRCDAGGHGFTIAAEAQSLF